MYQYKQNINSVCCMLYHLQGTSRRKITAAWLFISYVYSTTVLWQSALQIKLEKCRPVPAMHHTCCTAPCISALLDTLCVDCSRTSTWCWILVYTSRLCGEPQNWLRACKQNLFTVTSMKLKYTLLNLSSRIYSVENLKNVNRINLNQRKSYYTVLYVHNTI